MRGKEHIWVKLKEKEMLGISTSVSQKQKYIFSRPAQISGENVDSGISDHKAILLFHTMYPEKRKVSATTAPLLSCMSPLVSQEVMDSRL